MSIEATTQNANRAVDPEFFNLNSKKMITKKTSRGPQYIPVCVWELYNNGHDIIGPVALNEWKYECLISGCACACGSAATLKVRNVFSGLEMFVCEEYMRWNTCYSPAISVDQTDVDRVAKNIGRTISVLETDHTRTIRELEYRKKVYSAFKVDPQ